MEKFFIIANCEKDEGLKISRKAEAYLKSKGKMCTIGAEKSCERDADNHYTDASAIPEGVECVIVLGGDGTLLHAARDVVDRQIPLLGINLGTLGYLAEIDHSNIESALNHLMLDEYTIEKRMMLSGRVFHQGELMARDVALNHFHGNRFHRIQPLRRRAYRIPGDEYSDHDTGSAAYPEYEKRDLPGG